MKRRVLVFLLACCWLPLSAFAADPFDGMTLTVARGPGADDVTLQWIGGQPSFKVYRATGPSGVVDPSNQLGESAVRSWVDTPPAGSIFFYVITSPCVYAPPEVCNGVDDDCDGTIDNNLTSPANDCSQQGPCAGAQPVCTGATGWRCNYFELPHVEIDASGNLPALESHCDGIDNNCNGTIDLDGFSNLGQTCADGLGVCRRLGNIVCTATQTATVCNTTANPGAATDEVCDGLDNDCDGLVDERTDSTGPLGTILHGWRDVMTGVPKPGGGTVWVYSFEASR